MYKTVSVARAKLFFANYKKKCAARAKLFFLLITSVVVVFYHSLPLSLGGGREEKRKRLPANPTILENTP